VKLPKPLPKSQLKAVKRFYQLYNDKTKVQNGKVRGLHDRH
jgi:hypothetical protein